MSTTHIVKLSAIALFTCFAMHCDALTDASEHAKAKDSSAWAVVSTAAIIWFIIAMISY